MKKWSNEHKCKRKSKINFFILIPFMAQPTPNEK